MAVYESARLVQSGSLDEAVRSVEERADVGEQVVTNGQLAANHFDAILLPSMRTGCQVEHVANAVLSQEGVVFATCPVPNEKMRKNSVGPCRLVSPRRHFDSRNDPS